MDQPVTAGTEQPSELTADLDGEFLAILAGEMGRLRRMARVLVGDPQVADDLVAEAIARTLPRWRAGRVADCGAYVRRVVANLAARRWRRLSLGRRRDHAALDWLGAMPDPADALAERDRTLRAVMRLPVRRRAVVLLRFYEDMSLRTIAATLGVSEGTVKSQSSRALEQLRGELEGQEAV
jgi:RNA polymerase sigma-70 factor (sigma-E family)